MGTFQTKSCIWCILTCKLSMNLVGILAALQISEKFHWRRLGSSLPGLCTLDPPLSPTSTPADIFRHTCLGAENCLKVCLINFLAKSEISKHFSFFSQKNTIWGEKEFGGTPTPPPPRQFLIRIFSPIPDTCAEKFPLVLMWG